MNPSDFLLGERVYHANFNYCNVVGFTKKRIRIQGSGSVHTVHESSLTKRANLASNAAVLPPLNAPVLPPLHAPVLPPLNEEREDAALSDDYMDQQQYNPKTPWPQAPHAPPSPAALLFNFTK